MTPPNTLRELFIHNDWARDKILALAEPLSDEQLDEPVEMGSGSLRATLIHMWLCEKWWLDRWRDTPKPNAEYKQPPELAVAAIADGFRQTAAERDAHFDAVGEAGFSAKISFTGPRGDQKTFPLGDMVLHIVNHGVHHRAQSLNMLRRLEVPAIGIDFLHMKIELPTVEQDEAARAMLVEMGLTPGDTLVPAAVYNLDTIREYFRYSDWATRRVCDVAAPLADEQLDREFEIGPGTLRRTLLHIYDAESWWRRNWTEGPVREYQQLSPTTSMSEFRTLLNEEFSKRDAYFASLTNEDLQTVVSAHATPELLLNFRLAESMLQLPTHGTHHRAQCLNMLRHLGAETPSMDSMDWYEADLAESA